MRGMTQQRSRMLGRALLAAAAIDLLLFVRGLGRRSLLASVLLAILAAPLSGLLAWVGYTLATTNWDDPADYPPSEDVPTAE